MLSKQQSLIDIKSHKIFWRNLNNGHIINREYLDLMLHASKQKKRNWYARNWDTENHVLNF